MLKRALLWLYLLAVPLLVFGLLLWLPLPASIGLAFRYNPAIGLLVGSLILYPAYRWLPPYWALAATLALFALPLSGLWHSGNSEYPILVAGLFPFTDGSDYYSDARRLLAGTRFDAISSGRPLFAGVLALLLGTTQGNLQAAIAVLVALVAIAIYLLASEVQRYSTPAAATLLTLTLFLFDRRFIGSTWTEQLGLMLGAIAAAILWRSAHQRHQGLFLVGLLLLTLALCARAGVFFILPALLLWGSFTLHSRHKCDRHLLLGGTLAILAGFALNHLVLLLAGRTDVSFSNFSYILYAQVVGSKDWRQIRFDYPEVLKLDLPEVTDRMYELALQEFLRDPQRLLYSSFNSVLTYFSPTADGLFGFTSTYGISFSSTLTTLALYSLAGMGLLWCITHRHLPQATLLLAAIAGTALSLPLVPPWIDGVASSMRVYAATLPLVAILPAIGLQQCNTLLSSPKHRSPQRIGDEFPSSNIPPDYLLMAALLSVLLCVSSPAIARLISLQNAIAPPVCTTSSPLVIRFNPNAAVNLVERSPDRLPKLSLNAFRSGMETVVSSLARRQSRRTDETRELLSVASGSTVIEALNLKEYSRLWVVLPTEVLSRSPRILSLCGQYRNEVFYADRIVSSPNAR